MKDELIKFAPLFAGLTENDMATLSAGFAEGQSSANAVLLKAGEKGEAIYLIGRGFVALSTQGGQNIATLGPGSILGEASLFHNTTLDFNAVALSDLEFWKLSDRKLREIFLQQPAIGLKLSQNFGGLLAQMEDYLVQRLSHTQDLSSLPPHTLQAVAKRLKPSEVGANTQLYHVGDMPAGLYLLESGAVELRSDVEVNGDRVQTLQPGQLFGALSLLTNKPYTQTAIAVSDSLLWTLPAEDFQVISGQHPGLRRSLGRNVRSRLSKADQAQAILRLAQMPLFTEVPPQIMQAIVQHMFLQHVPAGERVYMVGEAGEALYLIETGEIELTAENASGVVEELARIGNGGFFGEMSLLTGQIRTEDATAIRNTNLWILHKSDLDLLANQYPVIGKALSQGLAARLSSGEEDYNEERFRKFPLFLDLSSSDLRQVVDYLRPTRYRGGEQIYRASSPADTLFLLEKGQVRIQPLSGVSWLLGPGEAFGERALLTNQPHNASATAESDIDVWTLSKSDFDTLMNRYPSLAISMSRILSQRLAQMNMNTQEMPGAAPDHIPAASATATNMPSRRRQVTSGEQPPATPRERVSFSQWFANLTPFGKIRLAVLILLLIWLLGIAAPAALLSLIHGTSVAGGADVSSRSRLLNAISAVYAIGSYDLASKDKTLAQVLAMADRQVPPTATYTPMATMTPDPTSTPTPTNTPTPLPTPTWTPTRVVVAYVPPPTATEVKAAAIAPRAWDPRLTKLGVTVEEASVASGQQYWHLTEARWQNQQEAAGRHHIYVEVLDENGNRIVGQPVTVFWGDGSYTGPTEDKKPPDYSYNYQMYAAGNAYSVKVEGLPSDILHGAGMGDLERPRYGIHTAFYLTFQRTTKP